MPSDQRTHHSELIQQRALERDLIAQLSPSKETQARAQANALRLRSLLERVKAHDRENEEESCSQKQ
jgi:hypothetical protein